MNCPECDATLKIPSDAINGEIVRCKDCGVEWELKISNGQIMLKIADKIQEDFGE